MPKAKHHSIIDNVKIYAIEEPKEWAFIVPQHIPLLSTMSTYMVPSVTRFMNYLGMHG